MMMAQTTTIGMGVNVEAITATRGRGWLDMGCEGGRSQGCHCYIQVKVDDSRQQEINSIWAHGVQAPMRHPDREDQKADWMVGKRGCYLLKL
jgi:hypothetical protein